MENCRFPWMMMSRDERRLVNLLFFYACARCGPVDQTLLYLLFSFFFFLNGDRTQIMFLRPCAQTETYFFFSFFWNLMHSEMISPKSIFAFNLGRIKVERPIDCLISHSQNSNSAVSGVWIKSLF